MLSLALVLRNSLRYTHAIGCRIFEKTTKRLLYFPQIHKLRREADDTRIFEATRHVRLLVYHAYGWGLLLYLAMATVTFLQYKRQLLPLFR